MCSITDGTLDGEVLAPTEIRHVTLRVGSPINLQCSLGGDGDHVPEWSKDGVTITSGSRYVITQSTPTELKIQTSGRVNKMT